MCDADDGDVCYKMIMMMYVVDYEIWKRLARANLKSRAYVT